MIVNRYPGPCHACGDHVEPQVGFLVGPPWRLFHRPCVVAPDNDDGHGARVVSLALKASGHDLRPYQHEGVAWLSRRRHALLADDQGLGKTVQVLAALPRGARVLVVCPAVARNVWLDHVSWLRPDLDPILCLGRDSWHAWSDGDVAVTSWACLPSALTRERPGGLLRALGDLPTHVVLDEAHYAKAPRAARTRRARALGQVCDHVWALTGTPLKNRPPDLHSVLQVCQLDAQTWPTWREFVSDWGGRKGRWGMEWDGDRADTIPATLRRVMLRRLKRHVLDELPAKLYDTITVDLDTATRRACDAATTALARAGHDLDAMSEVALQHRRKGAGFDELAAAAKALASAKLPALLDLLDLWEQDPEPRIVWCRHVAPLQALTQREGWEAITGSTGERQRSEYVERFQRGELCGLALSIGAAGTAITLTAASHAIYLDRAWTPSDNVQSEDRIHRIGQRRACRYTLLVADHALDRALARILHIKQQVINSTVDAAVNDSPPTRRRQHDITTTSTAMEGARRSAEGGRDPAQVRPGTSGRLHVLRGRDHRIQKGASRRGAAAPDRVDAARATDR